MHVVHLPQNNCALFSRSALQGFYAFAGVIFRAAAGRLRLQEHTSFFAFYWPFPGVLEHTPAVAQPLAFALASLAVAEATGHRPTTDHQAGAPLAVPFSPLHELQAA